MTIKSALRQWERECWDAYNGEHYDPAKGCYVSDYEKETGADCGSFLLPKMAERK